MPTHDTSFWLNALALGPFPFAEVYGPEPDIQQDRAMLLRRTPQAHLQRFGDGPVRVFRSPGRINLRGMHVDTHGGYLNLMTHQREAVVVARPSDSDSCVWNNIDLGFEESSFSINEKAALGDLSRPWLEYITSADVSRNLAARRGHWENYLAGAMLSIKHRFPGAALQGLHATVGSDIPRGAALSSSHALCVAALLAGAGWNGITLSPAQGILAARDAEWYTGARSGVSDQGAMFLGRREQMVNVALFAEELEVESARYLRWPFPLCVLVVHSHTQRSLSGRELVDYTRNRFAYSMAMEILRQEMQAMGRKDTAYFDRLSRMTTEALGGDAVAFEMLKRIPQEISIDEMRQRYILPKLDETYAQYFGGVAEADRPTTVKLRGPLLFGLTESERARVFYGLLENAADHQIAGELMTLGHLGDQVSAGTGASTKRLQMWSDTMLDALIRRAEPFFMCPGDYRASSPVLDLLVKTARDAGALGASLTGAGIAGSILALCKRADAKKVSEALRHCLRSDAYRILAKKDEPLSEAEVREAVVVNHATAGAGELVLS